MRFLWALGLALAACAPLSPVKVGSVDPEFAGQASAIQPVGPCALRLRASVPIEIAELPLVPVRINGHPATLVLDTGAETAVLTEAAAKRLGVTTKYDFRRSLSGIGRAIATNDARLDSFSLGGVSVPYPRTLVGNLPLRLNGAERDGMLGASLLADFDLDIDMPHKRLDLYDRLDCDSVRPPWAGRAVTLQTTRSLSRHPFFPIQVNGRTLSATLDTGAQRTVVSSSAAAAAGIDATSQLAGHQVAQGAVGELLPAFLHLVDVSVAGIKLHGPVLVTAAGFPRDIDALVGLDFLMSNRVWLSYGARRIFILPE